MKSQSMLAVVVAVFGLTLVVSAQRGNRAETLLGAGLHQEDVDENCTEAIKIYERVLRQRDATKNVAARAQFHIGLCREKLGQGQARTAYDAVLSRYADQSEIAAQARARIAVLAAQRPGTGMTSRLVWNQDPDVNIIIQAVSPDGQYLAYSVPRSKPDFFLRDLLRGVDRPLPVQAWAEDEGHLDGVVFSPDGKRLVYSWHYLTGEPLDHYFKLWVLGLDGSKASGPTLLHDFRRAGLKGGYTMVNPTDWSPDGTSIAAMIHRGEHPASSGRSPLLPTSPSYPVTSHIGLINARDGTLTTITSAEERSAGHAIPSDPAVKARFSPDGRFIAYPVPGVKPSFQDDIAIVPVAGGAGMPLVVEPARNDLVGWSPDGSHVLYTSNRTGGTNLYAVRFAAGKVPGTPVLVKQDFSPLPVGITGAGHLLYPLTEASRAIRGDIKIASYDFASERFIEPPVVGVKDFVGRNSAADWSPDGKYLVNLSARKEVALVIHSAETGELVRELRSGLTLDPGSPWPRWTPDSKAIAVPASDVSGRQGIYRVDAQTGQASPLVLSQSGERLNGPAFSSDGTRLVYNRILPGGRGAGGQAPRVIMERNLERGVDREIMRGNLSAVLFSPDGRYFTTVRTDADACSVLLVPTSGGESRDLMRAAAPCRLWAEMWAPDSRSVFVADVPEPLEEFWRVSVGDGSRRKVRLDRDMGLQVRVHPDGRRLAYAVAVEQAKTEIWILENVLSALNKK